MELKDMKLSELEHLKREYEENFRDDSPFMRINRGYFFSCMKAVEEEIQKRM